MSICYPQPMRPGRVVPVLCPLAQVLPEGFAELQTLCLQSLENISLSQELLSDLQNTMQLAANVKLECETLSGGLKEQGLDEETTIVSLLYTELPEFSYYIKAIPEIKRIMFKRRQLRMTFRIFDTKNAPVAVPGRMQYTIKVFTCAPPYREVAMTGTGTPIIVGETLVEADNKGEFEFFNICFTAGSSKYPHGYFNLVIMCLNSDVIEPLVVEKVNVRLKYRKVMIMKNRRKKICQMQQAQIFG